MTISEFYSKFSTEESCRLHLKAAREESGIECKKCGGTKQYWLKAKFQWQCSSCDFRTTLRSGTLFEASKLKLKTWFEALYLISNNKKGMSASELQRQLGLKRNEPAWYMMQKIRRAMQSINEKTILTEEIEMDDGFFTVVHDPQKKVQSKRGRGTSKQKVLVMVESEAPTDGTHKGVCGKLRMIALPNLDQGSIWEVEDRLLQRTTKIRTDGFRGYNLLDPMKHEPNAVSSKTAHKILPWVHTAIGNAKRLTNGIYHHISQKFAQLYLDEFSFKFNYRYHKARWKVVFQEALNFNW